MIFDQLSPDELEEVQRRIGGMILLLPVASGQLGHATSANTIKGNYLRTSRQESKTERIAKEFINDLFQLKTSEMCEKWYGDPTGASVRMRLKILA